MAGSSADVVIVGGGSCGAVLAARLSTDPDRRVLLLDAGDGYVAAEGIPPRLLDLGVLPVGEGEPATWRYDGHLTDARRVPVMRGFGLGGSGAVNGGYFVRATRADLAAWDSDLWTYDAALPYFCRSETDLDHRGPRHGDSGPIPVHRDPPDRRHPISAAFHDAALDAGFPAEPDKNDSAAAGIGPVPLNARDGVRVNTALAYLLPVRSRHNLEIRGHTRVLRVLLDGDRAVGVQVERAGTVETIPAGTVVLCSGGVGSPLLLMRSGIGPADELRGVGIAPLHELSGVGRGFSDHPEIAVPYRYRDGAMHRPGTPVLQVCLNVGDEYELRPYTASFTDLVAGSPAMPPQLGVALMNPASRGEITLDPADPQGLPRVRYRYLELETDRRSARHGLDLALDLLAAPQLRALAQPLDVDRTDDWISAHLGTSQHLSGSCRMGPDPDAGAVVDERCRVHGLEGLAVVDTSVIPRVPSRGPHATAVMLAERAAELL
ncbi:mycofactocin system GMC family oxidoreductase MftG [Rhodococcus sp. D2-41]|uniref:Mycofactocin system GMC family oxidoreductase MftG n=1 Tax=Speluncibacter jeojiensis TaxID=2710754 RepID=A0A9X4M2C1_9ACTN|nr:mycofactocin system GMC family oxidoreductase MftG [Rhodococcus sp. D2-41]MDG3011694.1 mycofactocin system GMC family oxidoreductase MftG [Rhodococcus sp. D2-41]MDG3014952.1 mycofactocin system GMC family oxidoreductase MftG [Corynebacteriales bacterium D3-21]